MIKLANTPDIVYVSMTRAEFKMVAKVGVGNVTDGASVNINWLESVTSFSDTNAAALQTTREQIDALSVSLKGLIDNAAVKPA